MHILMIEESETIASIIQKTLESYGYIVTLGHPERVTTAIRIAPFTFAIISTQYSQASATDICNRIRSEAPGIFIIAIHSRGNWENKLNILKSGADDCLGFPFPTQELVARMQALLRRPRQTTFEQLKVGMLEINPNMRTARYKRKPLSLTRKEYLLLEYLIRNKNRPVSRAELLDHVWDYRRVTGSNTVDVHVQRLRRKFHDLGVIKESAGPGSPAKPSKSDPSTYENLENLPAGAVSEPATSDAQIRTVHGVGYKIEDNVT